MAAADTNVVLRLLLEDDDAQTRAARAFLRAKGPLFVSHVVLAEVVWVLTSVHGFERADVSAFVEMLLATDGFELQDPFAVKDALDAHGSSKAEFSDCLVLAIARRSNALPLGTFDRKLARLDGAQRVGPKTLK
jgi:predicted nucleic-acid-binding protein